MKPIEQVRGNNLFKLLLLKGQLILNRLKTLCEGEVKHPEGKPGSESTVEEKEEVKERCLPGLGYIHHYSRATGGVPYPRVDIGKFSNIILL